MRKQCVFQGCQCAKYMGHSKICNSCNHGVIWHERDQLQFQSTREMAKKPHYVCGIYMPQVPDLPENEFCKGALPV